MNERIFDPASSRRDLWELTANLTRIAEWPVAGEFARAKSLPEHRPFGRSQTPKSDRLRQPLSARKAGERS
jgi:hypothetical protein